MSNSRRSGSEHALTQQLRELQDRLESTVASLPKQASDVYDGLAKVLRRAILNEVLKNGEHDVRKLLQMTDGTPGSGKVVFALAGGPKDFTRLAAGVDPRQRFVREDGAVIHFTVTLAERPEGTVELLAYDFEIYFPSQQPISFIRFDLNPGWHSNQEQGLRAHVHPGHEDLQLPSPMLAPAELLSFLLYRCRLHRDVPRADTFQAE